MSILKAGGLSWQGYKRNDIVKKHYFIWQVPSCRQLVILPSSIQNTHPLDSVRKKMVGTPLFNHRIESVLAVGHTSSAKTHHGAFFFWGRHYARDICQPRRTRMHRHPRDIFASVDEIDSGGTVTLGRMSYVLLITTLPIFYEFATL